MGVRRKNVARTTRHGMRGESARRCIGVIEKGCDIFGLTKGDFSMIDILRHVIDQIGPCNIDVGTWTAAHSDIKQAHNLLGDNRIKKARFLVDRSFPTRQPKYYEALLLAFGRDCVRMANFHAKYILAENEEFSVAVRTSMNLNKNQRIEFYEISEGSSISDYLREVTDYHFAHPFEDSWAAFKNFDLSKDPEPGEETEKQAHLGGW